MMTNIQFFSVAKQCVSVRNVEDIIVNSNYKRPSLGKKCSYSVVFLRYYLGCLQVKKLKEHKISQITFYVLYIEGRFGILDCTVDNVSIVSASCKVM